VRVRAAHRDYKLTEPYPEEWLLAEWRMEKRNRPSICFQLYPTAAGEPHSPRFLRKRALAQSWRATWEAANPSPKEAALAFLRALQAQAGLPRGVVLMDAGYGASAELRWSITALDLTYVAGILPNTSVGRGRRAIAAKAIVRPQATSKTDAQGRQASADLGQGALSQPARKHLAQGHLARISKTDALGL